MYPIKHPITAAGNPRLGAAAVKATPNGAYLPNTMARDESIPATKLATQSSTVSKAGPMSHSRMRSRHVEKSDPSAPPPPAWGTVFTDIAFALPFPENSGFARFFLHYSGPELENPSLCAGGVRRQIGLFPASRLTDAKKRKRRIKFPLEFCLTNRGKGRIIRDMRRKIRRTDETVEREEYLLFPLSESRRVV